MRSGSLRNGLLMRSRLARAVHRLCCLAAVVLLTSVSCSGSKKDDSAQSAESVFAQVKRQADPVAEVTAGVAVAKLSNDGSSVDATTAEMRTAHASTVQQLQDSLCKTLQGAGDRTSKKREEARTMADQALRDSFVLKFLQAAAAASPERQAEIVKILGIKSTSPDGTALEGGAALKDASLTSSQGTLQIPPTDSPEYTKYTDWLVKNPALSGFTTVTLTEDYTKAMRQCI